MISFETGSTGARFNSQLFLMVQIQQLTHQVLEIKHTDANARLDISRSYSDDSAPPYLEFHKTRNGTIGGNGLVQNGMS